MDLNQLVFKAQQTKEYNNAAVAMDSKHDAKVTVYTGANRNLPVEIELKYYPEFYEAVKIHIEAIVAEQVKHIKELTK